MLLLFCRVNGGDGDVLLRCWCSITLLLLLFCCIGSAIIGRCIVGITCCTPKYMLDPTLPLPFIVVPLRC